MLKRYSDEWSTIARAVIKRRDYLIALGLSSPRRSKTETDENVEETVELRPASLRSHNQVLVGVDGLVVKARFSVWRTPLDSKKPLWYVGCSRTTEMT